MWISFAGDKLIWFACLKVVDHNHSRYFNFELKTSGFIRQFKYQNPNSFRFVLLNDLTTSA